ncbi:aspartate 1-decarboxylase [Candidatus Thioglobus sp.]|uniref:aspartate 1-decarboxylase n=1 Tax=Candidatus Thioglobus sp. TaxID=2026721 RepID=UPI003D116C57
MQRTFLKAKLHRVTTTASELAYEGSCAIDGILLDAAGISAFEQIQIYNITNGNRFTTYAIRGKENTGVICVNGAAAHKAATGDLLIIAAYASYNEQELKNYAPSLCYVDEHNVLIKKSLSIS